MKLYDEKMPAPNPRRVRIFLAEKGQSVPLVHIKMMQREHKSPEFLAKNSLGQLPVLELDDGTCISETIAICRYLESLYPAPPMFGATPLEQALIEMWVRRIEFQLGRPVSNVWRHADPRTAFLGGQFPDFGASNRDLALSAYRWLDGQLAKAGPFIAGSTYSIADITALTTIDFGAFIGLPVPDDLPALKAWHSRVSARPSAAA